MSWGLPLLMAWRTDKMGIRNENSVERGCFFFNLKTQVPTSCFSSWFFVLPFLSLYHPFKNYFASSFLHQASLVVQMAKKLPAMWESWVQSLGWLGRSPGEGNGYPLQYSGLENSMNCIGRSRVKDTVNSFPLIQSLIFLINETLKNIN